MHDYLITFRGDAIKQELKEFEHLNNPFGSSIFSSVEIDQIVLTKHWIFDEIAQGDTSWEFLNDPYFQRIISE